MSDEVRSPGYLSIVRKGETPQETEDVTASAWEENREYKAFGAVPQAQHLESLWLRRQSKTQSDVFLDYAWRRSMLYARQGNFITILFRDCSVKIVGRNLHHLMGKLHHKKVAWIEEHDPARWPEPDPGLPFVSEIVVEFFKPA